MNPTLAKLPEATLAAIAGHTRLTRFKANERLFSRGDEILLAGVIIRGGIRNSLIGYDGHEMSMSVLRRGAFYGWIGLVSPTPSPWDIYAQGETEIACFQISDFRNLMKQHPELNTMIAEALSARLRKSYDHMYNLVLDTLDTRLRRTLVMLTGDRTMFSSGDTPHIKITQETLASFVQCSRPTVNKLLKDLEKEGLIRLGYGEIIIPDLEALYPHAEVEQFHLL
ncbi:Crp/Fnr family transcriptional regulator [Rhodophyticola sp. CCM32]|uniref:Crp/Fnr family transcriptional regulator n=1 Tax=Rhodophyticola sp. CCM32 TaxID=2916397 RepID=UPI00107EEC72|nr:Crp/Fnr family transcriptional regulator [Rhodophyticola sp. CCM32]QBX99795.1 Crp/Fnr family transcriptional regulator [Rhodophyticola sp. CCM32]